MNISKINLVNFRNYSKLSINLGQNMNIFIGNNAQGKTNILESIMFLALTKSPRVFNESDLIKYGLSKAIVKGKVKDNNSIKEMEISLEKGINVKYVLDGKTVGMASFVTNGGYAGLIMDVVVLKEYRGKGYGTILIESILNYIKSDLEDNEEMMIQLLSAPGKQDFYSKFGFKVKKEIAEDGMYMWLRKE